MSPGRVRCQVSSIPSPTSSLPCEGLRGKNILFYGRRALVRQEARGTMGSWNNSSTTSSGVWISVGEASGDMYGAMLVRELTRLRPGIRCMGLGGSAMREAGFDAKIPSEALSVMGLIEVIGHLPKILGMFRKIKEMLAQERPSAVVLIDSPDFNFRIAKMARRLGIPVIYYITPQVWAWRKGRVKFLKRWVNRLLCIFPFEEPFFREHGLDATFVGNPLLELMDLPRLKAIAPEPRRIAILPGSRKKEVFSLLPVFARAASYLAQSDPGIRFTLIQAPHVRSEWIRDIWPADLPVDIFPSSDRYEELRKCRFVIAASGTATFECALLGVPTMLAYKVASVSYYVGRLLIKVPFIGMANLILKRRVFPEFIQHEATPEAMAAQAQVWLEHPEYLDEIIDSLEQLPEKVGPVTATRSAAEAVLEYVPS